jgi:outer membrane protein insertion porin family
MVWLRGRACRLLGFLLASLLLLTSAGFPQTDLVIDVKVHGNRKIPADTIKARIFTKAGDIYDAAGLERDFNSLWNTGYFEDVRFEREQTPKGWVLHVYVKERPVIREINYVGVNAVSQSDILERFKKDKVGLSKESQFDPTKVKHAEVVLKELLSEHGRQFATVRTEVRPIPPAAVGITFAVKEGPKVKVGRITFQGNKNVNSRVLRNSMKNLKPVGIPHSIFLEGLFSKTYDASKLSEDAERVRFEYHNRGYFKALVEDPTTKIRDTGHEGFHFPLLQHGPGKAVDITMPIEEGLLYKLGKITFKDGPPGTNYAALRGIFALKDGDVFSQEKIGKGLENLRKAFGQQGYINFTPNPDTDIDDEKRIINLEIQLDQGKQFYVRRIEFQGNTTTRDKVIRREMILEEGQVYDSRRWEISLLRLNQLGYFEQLKPDDSNITDKRLDEKNGLVDLTLKVKEKGKNSIGLTGGVSGLAGAFIGINYSTNNLFGLGETLEVQASVGNQQRNILFGFTEPYLFDRPLQAGFTVYNRRYDFNQAKQFELLTGQKVNLSDAALQNLQNFQSSSYGFSLTLSYPLRRSLKRVGISYAWDNSTTKTFSNASQQLFQSIAYRGITGPNALAGVITSKIIPSFSFNTLDAAYAPHRGHSLTLAAEIAGIGGNVNFVRPIVNYKRFFPVQKGRNTIGMNLQGSFLSGFGGLVAPPFDRFYMGGENDIRGFDVRSVGPFTYLPTRVNINLTNPDGSVVRVDPSNPRSNPYTIPIPVQSVVYPGGDTSAVANFEYRYTIAGPVTLAPFMDFGLNGIARSSQLRIGQLQLQDINSFPYGCPERDFATNCVNTITLAKPFSSSLQTVPGTNFTPRMSAGLELQVMLPVINAPFRIYWAYNPLRLNTSETPPIPITRSMFPVGGAGDYTYQQAISLYSPKQLLKEPLRTFRFTVATTF